jgi:hypothetical protein
VITPETIEAARLAAAKANFTPDDLMTIIYPTDALSKIKRNSSGYSNVVVAQTWQPTSMAAYSRTTRIRHDARLASLNRSMAVNIFYVIGVVVVITVIAGFFALRV